MERYEITKSNYERVYSEKRVFLRYPADWVIRFHNMMLSHELDAGAKVLDYGIGSGNNAVFLAKQGYDIMGADVTDTVLPLVAENFNDARLPVPEVEILDQVPKQLPWRDASFDFVLSNQVLYYLPGYEELTHIAAELHRITRPGGVFFLTMMGSKNYYIRECSRSMENGVFEVFIGGDHRLAGSGPYHEYILVPKGEGHLCELMRPWKCEDIGYFDQRMGDMTSNFHWIFVGRKEG